MKWSMKHFVRDIGDSIVWVVGYVYTMCMYINPSVCYANFVKDFVRKQTALSHKPCGRKP